MYVSSLQCCIFRGKAAPMNITKSLYSCTKNANIKCLEKFSMKDKFRVRVYSERDVQGSFVQTRLGTNVVFRVFSALYL